MMYYFIRAQIKCCPKNDCHVTKLEKLNAKLHNAVRITHNNIVTCLVDLKKLIRSIFSSMALKLNTITYLTKVK